MDAAKTTIYAVSTIFAAIAGLSYQLGVDISKERPLIVGRCFAASLNAGLFGLVITLLGLAGLYEQCFAVAGLHWPVLSSPEALIALSILSGLAGPKSVDTFITMFRRFFTGGFKSVFSTGDQKETPQP